MAVIGIERSEICINGSDWKFVSTRETKNVEWFVWWNWVPSSIKTTNLKLFYWWILPLTRKCMKYDDENAQKKLQPCMEGSANVKEGNDIETVQKYYRKGVLSKCQVEMRFCNF